jgi:hypothetical protein
MESPFFERSRFPTDYHCKVAVYSALSIPEVNSVLRQLARQSSDERFLSQSRDYIGGSPVRQSSRDIQLPNPIPIVIPLTEPTNKAESSRARVNMKIYLKTSQVMKQELVVDAVAEFDRRMIVDFVVLLFDLTNRASFEALDKLLQDFKKEYSDSNLAEPTTILVVGMIQSQEIHQLIFRDEIDLWCSRQETSANIAIKYLEYTLIYGRGAYDLLAFIMEPFQGKYNTLLSREKTAESPNRNSLGTGFFQSLLSNMEKVHDGEFGAMGINVSNSHEFFENSGTGQRKKSVPTGGMEEEYTLSKSELLERREEQKRYERQRKWKDMESQMRLMLESDELEENRLAEIERHNQQQAAGILSNLMPLSTSSGSHHPPLQGSSSHHGTPIAGGIASSAFGFFRQLPSLPPSPSNAVSNSASVTTAQHQQQLSLASSSGTSTPPPNGLYPLATSSTSPSMLVTRKSTPKYGHQTNSSLKSRSDDAYDPHPYVQSQQPHSHSAYSMPVHGGHVHPQAFHNNNFTNANDIRISYPAQRLRPVSTSSLHLPPLPAIPSVNSIAINNNNNNCNNNNNNNTNNNNIYNNYLSSSSSLGGGSLNHANHPHIAVTSSSSSSMHMMHNVMKRTTSMISQASQRTSSQVSLRSRHSSHYTINSSRASSGLDLRAPSGDDINKLIENMHSAVKSEQDLYHQTMYLYGANGSDLLILSSEDEDDDDGDEDDDSKIIVQMNHMNTRHESRHGSVGDEDGLHDSYQPLSSNTTSQQSEGRRGHTTPGLPHPNPSGPAHHNHNHTSPKYGQQRDVKVNSGRLSNNYSAVPYRSYISDLSTSSRYTQTSLEERGLIDPDRIYTQQNPHSISHTSPKHLHNQSLSSSSSIQSPFSHVCSTGRTGRGDLTCFP